MDPAIRRQFEAPANATAAAPQPGRGQLCAPSSTTGIPQTTLAVVCLTTLNSKTPSEWVLRDPQSLGHRQRPLPGRLGFRALATKFGLRLLPQTAGLRRRCSRQMVLAHFAEIAAATSLPVNADFQNGYAADAEGVAESVRRCVATGVADYPSKTPPAIPPPALRSPVAVERLAAARAACTGLAHGARRVLPHRPSIRSRSDPPPAGLRAAGADVLYAPGDRKPDWCDAIVRAGAPKPVNVLMFANSGLRVADLAALGVRRISVDSYLARTAWTGFMRAAQQIAEEGSFAGFEGIVPFADLNSLFE